MDNNKCPAIHWKYFACNEMDHPAKSTLCTNKVHELSTDVNAQEPPDGEEACGESAECGEAYFLNLVARSRSNENLRTKLPVEGKCLLMEVDSRACKSVIHIDNYKERFSKLRLEPCYF